MPQGHDRSSYEIDYHPAFDTSLRKVRARGKRPTTDGTEILSDLGEFMADWINENITLELVNTTWDFKQITRVHGQAIMQFDLGRAKNYRCTVLNLSSRSPPRLYFLHIYRRTSRNQVDLDRSVERANSILRELV